jgi:chemotaxis protein MotB
MILNNENLRSIQKMEEPEDEEGAIDFDEEDEDEEGGESWMGSYADLITDLMAVFVILYAFAAMSTAHQNKALKTENKSISEQSQQIKEEIQDIIGKVQEMKKNSGAEGTDGSKGLNSEEILEQVGELLESLGAMAGIGINNATGSEDAAGKQMTDIKNQFDSIYELIKNKISEGGYSDMIELKKGDGFYTFRFKDNLLFYPDSPNMRSESFEIVEYIGDLLKSVENAVESIEIAGHTADVGPDINFFSWKLSANRAITILEFLIKNSNLPESKMLIAGYSKNKPVAGNETESDRALNRRVEMKVYRVNSVKPQ